MPQSDRNFGACIFVRLVNCVLTLASADVPLSSPAKAVPGCLLVLPIGRKLNPREEPDFVGCIRVKPPSLLGTTLLEEEEKSGLGPLPPAPNVTEGDLLTADDQSSKSIDLAKMPHTGKKAAPPNTCFTEAVKIFHGTR